MKSSLRLFAFKEINVSWVVNLQFFLEDIHAGFHRPSKFDYKMTITVTSRRNDKSGKINKNLR